MLIFPLFILLLELATDMENKGNYVHKVAVYGALVKFG